MFKLAIAGALVALAAPAWSPSLGVGSAQAAFGHSRLASLPSVLPPRALARPMAWSHGGRIALDLRITTVRQLVVVGLEPDAALPLVDIQIVQRLPALNAVEIRATPSRINLLRSRRGVRYIEHVETLGRLDSPNDPFLTATNPQLGTPYEWNFAGVGADAALERYPGSPLILVGYIDSGVGAVPDLVGKVAETWWLPSEGSDATDTEGHGTFVASIIAAPVADGFGLAGFCGLCRVVPFKLRALTNVAIASAISKLVAEHVRVINLSIGGPQPSLLLRDAVVAAGNAGVLIVASAGNDGTRSVSYPAAYVQPDDGVLGYGLAVGASDHAGSPAAFSNSGTALSLLAPGTWDSSCQWGVLGALPAIASDFDGPNSCSTIIHDSAGNRYAYASGTSFSAPEVAGTAALIFSINPALKNYDVARILEQTATRPGGLGWAADRGWGVLDSAAAATAAAATLASPPPSPAPPSAPPPSAAPPPVVPASAAPGVFLGLRLRGDAHSRGVLIATANASTAGDSATVETTRCAVTVGPVAVKVLTRNHGTAVSCAWMNPSVARRTRGLIVLEASLRNGARCRIARAFTIFARKNHH